MGCYVNPHDMSKEKFLLLHGTPVLPAAAQITEDELPVCLVHNGPFNAAAVAFSEDELNVFKHEDGRPKKWFMVAREKLRAVSDLASWER